MKNIKNKKLQSKVQALSNQWNIKENKKVDNSKNYKEISLIIKKDLIKTLFLIAASFGILFLIKHLDSNLFFNKFF